MITARRMEDKPPGFLGTRERNSRETPAPRSALDARTNGARIRPDPPKLSPRPCHSRAASQCRRDRNDLVSSQLTVAALDPLCRRPLAHCSGDRNPSLTLPSFLNGKLSIPIFEFFPRYPLADLVRPLGRDLMQHGGGMDFRSRRRRLDFAGGGPRFVVWTVQNSPGAPGASQVRN